MGEIYVPLRYPTKCSICGDVAYYLASETMEDLCDNCIEKNDEAREK